MKYNKSFAKIDSIFSQYVFNEQMSPLVYSGVFHTLRGRFLISLSINTASSIMHSRVYRFRIH